MQAAAAPTMGTGESGLGAQRAYGARAGPLPASLLVAGGVRRDDDLTASVLTALFRCRWIRSMLR